MIYYSIMSETELAWAAGFFDGEGHTQRKRKTRVLSIGQKYPDCLERFKAAIGHFGRLYGPYTKEMFYWSTTKLEDVDTVLTMLWPYLSKHKKNQAIEAGFLPGKIAKGVVGRPKPMAPSCHPEQLYHARGLCKGCYYKQQYQQRKQRGK